MPKRFFCTQFKWQWIHYTWVFPNGEQGRAVTVQHVQCFKSWVKNMDPYEFNLASLPPVVTVCQPHVLLCVCVSAVVQLCSIQYCCLVTACWAGGRIKCCRCVWGNLWRAFEEGVSHSSWSSSRTESWTSHLLRGFYPHNTSLCLTPTIETVREH